LGVLGTHVFFNDNWVDFDDRQNYLLDADLGVSTHFQHVETTFSFRTRILDYLWAGLPIVTTEGDSFGDLVAAENLGASVPERDQAALLDALETYLYDRDKISEARSNVARVREEFRWSRTLSALVEFCKAPVHAADKKVASAKLEKASKPASKRVPSTGLRRDVERAMYYLREGGPTAVVERYRARAVRRRDAQS
jgi:hypothetical protein